MDEFENADGFEIEEINEDDLAGIEGNEELAAENIEDEITKLNVIEEIEKIVFESKCDYITAAIELARKLDWDPAWLAPYISGPIKTRLQLEGEELGILRRDCMPAATFE